MLEYTCFVLEKMTLHQYNSSIKYQSLNVKLANAYRKGENMKFTEGYWLASERANPIYASDAYAVEAIENGMRVVAPGKKIQHRGDTLNQPTITIEFTSVAHNVVHVRAYHYEAYAHLDPRFEREEKPDEVEITITDEEAVMVAGDVTVRVNREAWGYQFEADGKVITSCGFRNLAHMQYDRQLSTMNPQDNYLAANYQPYMVNELSLQPGECVYGLGERFSAFVKNGQSVDTWNEDGGTSSQIAYKSIPFYLTNKGYGIFVDHSDNVSFEVASEKVEYVGFSVPGEEIRYDFIYGPTPKEVLSGYTALTGRPALPPAWSFGLWLSTSFTTNYDEETTSSFIDGMAERDIPVSVFHFDCFWMKEFQWCDFEWDERVFPDVPGMLKRYKEKGLKIDLWINPYIAQGTEFFREGVKNGYFLQRQDGRGPKQVDMWQTGMALVDFTNPEASQWYRNKLKTLLDMGVDCFKTDFGERIPIDVTYYDGSNPKAMHNYYTYLYNKCVFELLEEERGDHEAVLFARSATAGCQKFPVHWGGDCSANYPSMAETLRGGLSFALSGFSFWSHDISGFEHTATPDVYKRWVAFGMLSTHSRLHGSTSYRVPWLFDDEANDVVRFFTKLKCRLMPYIFAEAIDATMTGVSVMRPMILEFPEDMASNYLDMQYMLGGRVLVAPIFNEAGKADYYLPEGKWTHMLSDKVYDGGRYYTDTYDYFSLPLFVRENSIIALGSNEERPDYAYEEDIELHIYSLEEGQVASCKIPNVDGEIVGEVRAMIKEERVIVEVNAAIHVKDVQCHNMTIDKVELQEK